MISVDVFIKFSKYLNPTEIQSAQNIDEDMNIIPSLTFDEANDIYGFEEKEDISFRVKRKRGKKNENKK